MKNELLQQKALTELLTIEYNNLGINAIIYSGNEFKRIDEHWAKKPDLIITNVPSIIHKRLTNSVSMKEPIGIEYKCRGQGTTQFIRAVKLQAQDRYIDGTYLIKETNKTIKLNTVTFTNECLIKYGHYSCDCIERFNEIKNTCGGEQGLNQIIFIEDMWAERVCWAFDMPLLLQRKNKFMWSYRNCFFSLDGKEVASYGKDCRLIEY